jgi:hypothetical protein
VAWKIYLCRWNVSGTRRKVITRVAIAGI